MFHNQYIEPVTTSKSLAMPQKKSASVSEIEVDNFSKIAGEWWKADGAFKALHRINPVRVSYVRDRICAHFGLVANNRRFLSGLTMLDVGCGGGLLSEPMAALGAKVTGIDASPEAVKAAKFHIKTEKLSVSYSVNSVENLAASNKRFDVITAFEIIEHVEDRDSFLGSIAKLLKKDGLLIMATVNRTTKSFLLGVLAAEYILKWAPEGAHEWENFVRPSELVGMLDQHGLTTVNLTGVVFDPLSGEFVTHPHKLDINYMLAAKVS